MYLHVNLVDTLHDTCTSRLTLLSVGLIVGVFVITVGINIRICGRGPKVLDVGVGSAVVQKQ